jgi:transcription antitermination protein NusB
MSAVRKGESPDKKNTAPTGRKRSAARLAAVQILYQMDITKTPASAALNGFSEDLWAPSDGPGNDACAMAKPDASFLERLTKNTSKQRKELDEMIAAVLPAERTVESLEMLMRAILRAGSYELLACLDIPARVVIDEYMNVADAFFSGNEPSLVNAVLDRLARKLRVGELSEGSNGA